MRLPSALIGSTEIIIDRWLNASGASPLSEELAGKQLRIEIETNGNHGPLTLLLLLDRNGIRLLQEDAETLLTSVDATISGTPGALLALVLDKSADQAEQPRISGDLQLVSKLSAHLHQGNFNLETLLTDFTGPQTAYHVSQWAGQTMNWLADSGKKLSANFADYLTYETNTLITPEEWRDLVEQLAELERRAGALQRRLTALTESKW